MANETLSDNNFVAPIIDDEQTGTLTCPSCGEKGQRPNRRSCVYCGQPFYPDARRCKACGSSLTMTGFCEVCRKPYWEIDMEQISTCDAKPKQSDIQAKKNRREILERSFNILPAKIPMIISVILSFVVLILFFVPMIQGKVSMYGFGEVKGQSHKVLEMFDLESAGFTALVSMIFKGSAWSALWPPLIALMGLLGAIFMPINNLTSLLKQNPMRRGRILYDAFVEPFFVILSIVVARAKVVPMFGKINAAGWVCIVLCVAVLALGIASYILLEKNCEEVKRCIPSDKEKKYKKYSQKKLLAEMGIWVKN